MINLQKGVQSRMIDRKPCLAQLVASRQRMREISVRLQPGKSVHDVFRQVKCLAGLTHCATTTKADHVGCHCGSQTPITPVDFLDHFFSTIATREIEIDIRPTFPALTEKTLKQKLSSYRINSSNS